MLDSVRYWWIYYFIIIIITASPSQQGAAGHVEARRDIWRGGRSPGILRQAHSPDRGQMSCSCPDQMIPLCNKFLSLSWHFSLFSGFFTYYLTAYHKMCALARLQHISAFQLPWSMWWCFFLCTSALFCYLEWHTPLACLHISLRVRWGRGMPIAVSTMTSSCWLASNNDCWKQRPFSLCAGDKRQ